MTDYAIRSAIDFTCQCGACQNGLDPRIESGVGDTLTLPVDVLDASADALAGTTAPNGKPIWSVEQIAAHLNRTGASWNDGPDPAPQRFDDDPDTITFGFFENVDEVGANGYAYNVGEDVYALDEYFNFASFGEAQRAATRDAMQSWDDVAAIRFIETDADNADINFGNLANAPQTQAYARLPFATLTADPDLNAQVQGIAGDVWVSASQASNYQLDIGGYGLQTLTHEVGHSLGLSHPGAYNAAPGVSFTYGNNAEYFQDSRAYTVMSYFAAGATGAQHFDFNLSTTVYSAVPSIHDIAAIQAMYGADMTTRTGDTVYGFNSNAGRDWYDFDKNPASVMTIWDAGGNDTIDASGYDTNQIIDLREGALSSIGGVTLASALSFEEVNANRAAAGLPPVPRQVYDSNMAIFAANPRLGGLIDNVGIAYGAQIENAIGGSGDDLLIGNGVANILNGGAGIDTASYRYATAGIAITTSDRTGRGGDAAGDTYISIERFEGSQFADVLSGGNGHRDDYLSGLGGDDRIEGRNGNDTLLGGAGDDYIDGGEHDDFLDGGEGNDTLLGSNGKDTIYGGAGNDYIDGGEHDDQLFGGSGDDQIFGRNGKDTISGGAGDDFIDAGEHDDVVDGGEGDDIIMGRNGRDVLTGGEGNDYLDGGEHDDFLDGGEGDDHLIGGNGRDTLIGGAGNDVLEGGQHDDLLIGGEGADVMTGGQGRDTFLFETADGATDLITDFETRQDRIDLSKLDAVSGTDALDRFTWIGSEEFTGTAGELRSFAEDGEFFLAGDVDGDGSADLLIVSTTQIHQSDIVFA
ncbi:M10 family metallopeptidase C-terminal domain-containing protein [Croceicoccus hydrothermalis]|uniref:M10 family metallopeptidase C-terminal domain-containing protein n=1 Tax=Croceicoccus hydrothermalis TaxID=2867964 RepID=UPI001EFB08BB|nr:M10 family metallopeptidase C-terminal domain-containing protein [Croceicoccus hydrothermalis]